MQAVQAVQASLDEFDALPPLGTDAVRCIIHRNIYFKCLNYFFILQWCVLQAFFDPGET